MPVPRGRLHPLPGALHTALLAPHPTTTTHNPITTAAGWGGPDCAQPVKRPCTNRYRGAAWAGVDPPDQPTVGGSMGAPPRRPEPWAPPVVRTCTVCIPTNCIGSYLYWHIDRYMRQWRPEDAAVLAQPSAPRAAAALVAPLLWGRVAQRACLPARLAAHQSHVGPDGLDLDLTARGATASRCAGYCDIDAATCWCPPGGCAWVGGWGEGLELRGRRTVGVQGGDAQPQPQPQPQPPRP